LQNNTLSKHYYGFVRRSFTGPGNGLRDKGLRDRAAEHAWVLRERFGMREGDVVAISGVNSVSLFTHVFIGRGISEEFGAD
jgi:hypothetical protein